jgi:riboflavin biosynthesis pyrimidine reductase
MLLPVVQDDLTDTDLDRAYAWPEGSRTTTWVRANMVATVDGAARSPEGLSAGISGEADRRVFGRLRGLADVVLAGAGTARVEGYRPARPKEAFARQRASDGQAVVPAIAVVSRSLRLDLATPLFTEALVPTLVITCAASDQDRRRALADVAQVIVAGDETVDLQEAVKALRARGLTRLHAEGGPHLLGDLAAAGQLDELLLTMTPLLAGGSYGADEAIPRILAGAAIFDAPRPLRLHHLLEEGGTLFASYRTDRP